MNYQALQISLISNVKESNGGGEDLKILNRYLTFWHYNAAFDNTCFNSFVFSTFADKDNLLSAWNKFWIWIGVY